MLITIKQDNMENSPAKQTPRQKANLPKAVVDAIAAKSPAKFAPGVTPDQIEQSRINAMQQPPVQAPNPMMPNRAGAPPRSMNDLVYQPLSNQGSMAYRKVKGFEKNVKEIMKTGKSKEDATKILAAATWKHNPGKMKN